MTIDPVRPVRPVQVTVAVWFQLAVVALFLGGVALVIAYVVHVDHMISAAAARMPGTDPDEVASARSGNVTGVLVVGVPLLLAAIWFAATLWPVRRGSNVGRILVFVGGGGILLLGLTQLCGGFFPFGLIAIALGDGDIIGEPAPVDGGRSFSEEVYGRSDTFGDVAAISGGLGALLVFGLLLATVLLLALPPAHQYFVPRASLPAGPPMVPYAGVPVAYPAGAHAGFQGAPWPYMICPDPSAHFPAVPASPPAQPSPEGAEPESSAADAGQGESSERGQER
ncbi:hypothetical protein AB0M46_41800 [Dactylosporangium sp. NPDC051485]|uniref:hypothetical protein n=1 Tax=Dactylosporangium sp. NPDC051485 TaxID=3154846 RepID=UPI00344314B0